MMRIPIATQSEAPQLIDIELAKKLEEEAEAAAAEAEAEEVAAAEAEEEEQPTNEGFQWDGDGDDDDDDTTWDGEDGDDTAFACSFDYEDDSSSSDNLKWWDGDDEVDDFEDLDHQVIESDDTTEVNDHPTEDLSAPDVDLNNQTNQQEHLIEIQSPTFYFYGQMPDPSGEKSTLGKYVDRDGTIYDGQWKNNHYHGYGSLFDPVENSYFVGQFENSQMEGPGDRKSVV